MKTLTARQLEVMLAYIRAGNLDETAEGLGITRSTVKQTLSACRHKLRVDRNRDLLNAAQEAGIIRFEVTA